MRFRVLSLSLLALLGCAGDPHGGGATGGDDAMTTQPTTVGTDPCATAHEQGCPCTTPGETTACQATRHSGTYTSCGPGLRMCGDAGTWGACYGPIDPVTPDAATTD
jgi:hypothetical protein